jgi:cytochrome bd-type quinol oxidase subunit 1
MKMAAAEALYHTSQPASFSLFTIGSLNGSKQVFAIKIPDLLSFLATGNFGSKVQGIDNIQALYAQTYGPGSYTPIIPVTYWSFRLMIGIGMLGALVALIALWVLWRIRRAGDPLGISLTGGSRRALLWSVFALPLLPLVGISFGWIFTEMGRQPWLVFGQMKTAAGGCRRSKCSAGRVSSARPSGRSPASTAAPPCRRCASRSRPRWCWNSPRRCRSRSSRSASGSGSSTGTWPCAPGCWY